MGQEFLLAADRKNVERYVSVEDFTVRTVTYPGVPGRNLNLPPLAAIAEGP